MKERELQDKFLIWLLKNKKDNEHIFEEVDTLYSMTDVVLYNGNKNNGYEIKLKDLKSVIEQALINQIRYERNFIVMPIKEFDNIKKLEEVYQKRIKELGLIGYDGKEFKILRNSSISKMVDLNYKFMFMDRIIRGFHKGGVNARKSYK